MRIAKQRFGKTIRELRYNLGEAYQDAGRHREAHEIFADLYQAEPDEQRFAVRLFVSAQALGDLPAMRRLAAGLSLSSAPVAHYLRARVLTAEKRYAEALALLQNIPGVLLETAELYLRLGRPGSARRAYERALAIDPDDARAYLGLGRVALRRRKFSDAVHAAMDALQRVHHAPEAHFLLGRALSGSKEYPRAAEAFRAAISLNPHFPEAHARLADLLEKQLGDSNSAREHRRWARQMIRPTAKLPVHLQSAEIPLEAETGETGDPPGAAEPPPVKECVIVVTGLPRSGTSMIMQMLAAGGVPVCSDGLRTPDEDNPRGYFEYEPVKHLLRDNRWFFDARGRAVKIVAPLLAGLPADVPCRVILCRRDLDDVLDSQQRMLERRGEKTVARRSTLKNEYARLLARARAMLAKRSCTQVLTVGHSEALADPLSAAEKLNRFLGGELDVSKMASPVGRRNAGLSS